MAIDIRRTATVRDFGFFAMSALVLSRDEVAFRREVRAQLWLSWRITCSKLLAACRQVSSVEPRKPVMAVASEQTIARPRAPQ